jgi:hypothetical protein
MNSVTMTARVQEFEEIDRTFDESIFYHQLTQVPKNAGPERTCPEPAMSGTKND